jgi:hypothetical protein
MRTQTSSSNVMSVVTGTSSKMDNILHMIEIMYVKNAWRMSIQDVKIVISFDLMKIVHTYHTKISMYVKIVKANTTFYVLIVKNGIITIMVMIHNAEKLYANHVKMKTSFIVKIVDDYFIMMMLIVMKIQMNIIVRIVGIIDEKAHLMRVNNP